VIAPGRNSACPKGRIFIVAAAGGQSPAVYAADFDLSGTLQNVSAQPALNFSLTADDRLLASDILLASLPKGGLLMVYQGGSISTLSPQPSWWDDFTDPKTNPPLQPGDRGAIFVWRSNDCGTTWERFADIDAAKVLGGRCAWPQKSKNGGPWRGGFDREELYVDSWSGCVFLTAGCMNGGFNSYPKQDAYLVFMSNNEGKTWTLSPAEFPRWAPLVMTSMPSGRVYFAHCIQPSSGSRLTVGLYWMDSPWQTKQGGVEIYYGDPTQASSQCGQIPTAKVTAKITQPGVIPISLARLASDASGDYLRVTYPAVIGTRQVQQIVNVGVKPDGSVVTVPVRTIEAEDPNGSVLQAAFVETDRFQMKKESNAALLYWLETTSAGKVFTRYAMVDGSVGWYPPGDLSVKSGKRDDWTPGGEWMGDYMKGAFFYTGLKLHFLGAWPVPMKSELRYNTVHLPGHVSHIGGLGPGKAVQAKPNPNFLENRVPPGSDDHFLTPVSQERLNPN
jgi:hypothetical protein